MTSSFLGEMGVQETEEMEYFERGLVSIAEYYPHRMLVLAQEVSLDPQVEAERKAQVAACLRANHDFFQKILELHESDVPFPLEILPLRYASRQEIVSSDDDLMKAQSTLTQFMREWSDEGAEEREQTLGKIRNFIEQAFGVDRHAVKVLLPGCGLGRLMVDLVLLGFSAEANDFSSHFLLSSNWFINSLPELHRRCCADGNRSDDQDSQSPSSGFLRIPIYPFVHSFNNVIAWEHAVRPVYIPDVNLAPLTSCSDRLSVIGGEFVHAYAQVREEFNVVATCFFLDTAVVLDDYLSSIHRVLKNGGYWVNCGPLVWHHRASVVFTLTDIWHHALAIGFKVIQPIEQVSTTYCANKLSMSSQVFQCAWFVLQKPFAHEAGHDDGGGEA
eukprot:ANDGO_06695.mRNA.1 Carnosine N-methyltransferase